MEVIVIESKAFQNLTNTLEAAVTKITEVIAENEKLKDDHYMSAEQVAAYLGLEKQWVLRRKEEIGAVQFGIVPKFKKSRVDAYCDKHDLMIPVKKRIGR